MSAAPPPPPEALKIVNILLPPTSINNVDSSDATVEDNERPTVPPGYVPPRPVVDDEVLFKEPTFTEKFYRYLVIVIYLGGLSSLGFFLSIYYVFFWDSSMPPTYKPTKKPPTFIKP